MPKKRITIQDIAQRAGVSYQTVSRVINGKPDVADDTRRRIEDVIRELNYIPSTAARSLRYQSTNTIGLIVPDSANPFFAEIAKGVENAGFAAGYNVILCNSNKQLEREMEYLTLLQAKQVDGIIFITTTAHIEQIKPLIERGIPVVMFYRDPRDLDLDSFVIDNHQVGYIAAQHLIELGHTRIACIRPASPQTASYRRVDGFKAALTKYGLVWHDSLMPQGDNLLIGGERAATELLANGADFTAIFACNDAMAIGAMRALRMAGYRVPHDVSVIGVDDIILASYMDPPLTTIAQPKQEAGEQAVACLIERMEKHYAGGARTTVLATQLITRESTASPSQ